MPKPEDYTTVEEYVEALLHSIAAVVGTGIVKEVSLDVKIGDSEEHEKEDEEANE